MADRRLRSSLLVRLLAVSIVVSVLSVAATAWLAARVTTRAVQQERGQAVADGARVYDELLGYAATHRDWAAAGPLVRELAHSTGRRIVVTGRDRRPLVESAAAQLPEEASATVDPLADGIDGRAVGPFLLSGRDRRDLDRLAAAAVTCLNGPPRTGAAPTDGAVVQAAVARATIVRELSGRPRVETGDPQTPARCADELNELAEPTAAEQRALTQLGTLTNACLKRQRRAPVAISLGGRWSTTQVTGDGSAYDRAVESCLAGARREQLTAYVAPPALLFVLDPRSPSPAGGFDLSPANQARIAGVAGLVLLVTIGVTVLVGIRVVRPLRALTTAADRLRDGDTGALVRVTGHDEIARLGSAFNAMAEQRRHIEGLRRAMVGDIAHEMRTPVTNVRGWLEAADEGVVPLDKELIGSLLEEALLLQHVIDDLQDLSAADAGELRLHLREVEVSELLTSIADGFAATAGGVSLRAEAPPTIWRADPIRLRQAIGNLVANAIRHTPPGGSVTLSARTQGSDLVIDVADTGSGIPADQQDLIFERFWRAEKSRSRQTGGSGLGLAIVRKLIEAHGGTAAVTSTPGRGSTFTLRLPAIGPQ
ncbi:sensor histidine kinase [Nucisporomicrobium flavum]|uniref:sensor histidine kinase n=1 Tax=Nucisporomicrobium flavum TaxID=2785915 RepID=UPI0018F6A860|nr:HAMP domain-containing sensor histidine kinase [Nucisporomicrobium flavum]